MPVFDVTLIIRILGKLSMMGVLYSLVILFINAIFSMLPSFVFSGYAGLIISKLQLVESFNTSLSILIFSFVIKSFISYFGSILD